MESRKIGLMNYLQGRKREIAQTVDTAEEGGDRTS